MEIRDLGRLDDAVLLYGGPYSNLFATKALFHRADALGILPGHRVCTGDAVAYGAHPVETTELVLAEGGALVAGNCERQLGQGAEDCGCGFDEGSTCDVLSKGWYPFALRALLGRPDLAEAFRAAPDIVVFTHQGVRVAVIHGGVSDIARFIWPNSPEAVFAEEVALIVEAAGPVDMVVAGHSGVPFVRDVAGVTWLNAGAVGLAPNDGSTETRFAVLENGSPRIESLTYDADAARAAMVAAGLTQGYDAAMTTGYWPSEDILPPELRRVISA